MKHPYRVLCLTFMLLISVLLPYPTPTLGADETDSYIWSKEVVKNISPEADDLRQKLSEEIQKVIAAGHLAPYRFAPNETNELYLWVHAGEPIYTFSEALKYLPISDTATQSSLRTYLKQEISSYPPYKGTAVYDRAPWLPLNVGTRREWYPLEALPIDDNYLYQTQPVIQTFYHMWDYADATGDLEFLNSNWPEIQSLFDELKDINDKTYMDQGGCTRKYGDIAGCIGMARLAYLANNSSYVSEATTRAIQGFKNGIDFTAFEQNAYDQNRYFTENGGDDSDPKASHLRTWVFLNLFPETSRFMRENTLSSVQQHLNFITFNIPSWNLAMSPGFVGGEVNMITPFVSYPTFQAYGQILEKNGTFLRSKLDVPLAKTGDLYYIQNLITTIKSYGQKCWVDIRNQAEICE